MHQSFVHFIPIFTTVFAVWFAIVLYRRYRERSTGPHLLWWSAGAALYAVGTFTESATTLLGWHEPLFRAWYISGALLGGAPLAQGTVYLLCARRTANRLTAILLAAILTASVCVLLAPIDYARVESFRLSGKVIEWRWVRMFSPFINLYAASFLIGGAVASGLRYRQQPDMRHRFLGNLLIAAGALLPGIGGTFTRFGHTEVLYVTELVGIVTIYLGYRTVTDGPSDHLTVRAMDTLAPSGTSRTCAGRS